MALDIRLVEQYDEQIFQELVHRNLEAGEGFIPAWDFQTPGDQTFQKSARRIRIGAFDNGRLVALSWGEAQSKTRFMMHMSLVEREYRERGIYSQMLTMMLTETKEFDEVDSCHQIFNNQIIATKLKQGFYIIGIDHSIMIGPRVLLRYFHNQKLFDLIRFRVGLTPDPRL